MSASASDHDPDYELTAEWAFDEPARKGKDSAGIGALEVARNKAPVRPPDLGVAGPSGTRGQAPVSSSYRLVDVGPDNLIDIDTNVNPDIGAALKGINPSAVEDPAQIAPEGIFSSATGFEPLSREEVYFHQPNISSLLEEDEDYNAEYPIGFRRANEADMAERAGQPPDASFTLATRRHPEFDTRFFGQRNRNVLNIARKTGTHISMPTDLDEPVLMMWGTKENLMAARHNLHMLLEHVQEDIEQGTRRVGGWAKIKAMPTDRKQELIDKMILDYRIARMYRLPPPVGFPFPAVGVFIWPCKELNPQSSLGVVTEMLDPIRSDQKVFIIFVRKKNMFKVLGDDTKSVETAVDRIYGSFCEAAAKNRRPIKLCLANPPSLNLHGTMVIINENHNLVNRQITVKRLEENRGIQVFLGGPRPHHSWLENWKTRGEQLRRANAMYIRKALQQGLQDIAYFRGHVKLRVYIGKMVLFGYMRTKDGVYDLETFTELVRNHQTSGEVIRSISSSKYGIGDKDTADEVIAYCSRRSDVFYPVDCNLDVNRKEGPCMEPQVSATFNLRLYEEKGSETIRLEVTFERLPGKKVYRPLHRRWLTIGGRTGGDSRQAVPMERLNRHKSPLDLKVIDLETDLAYHIEISTWVLHREPDSFPIFEEFIRRLSVEEIPDEFSVSGPPLPGQRDTRPKVLRVSFVNFPGLSVANVVQKMKWRYWMANTTYILELTRYDNLPVNEVTTLYPDGVPISYRGLNAPFDTRYGCSVWDKGWDEKLSQQSVAEIGTRGSWEPDVDKFFPCTGAGRIHPRAPAWGDDGVLELLGRVQEVLEIIKDAQENAALKKQAQKEGWPMAGQHLYASDWAGAEEFDS